MKSKLNIINGILFSLLICFIFVGYAALTDSLELIGNISGTPQDNVFIADITVNNEELSKVSINGFDDTVFSQFYFRSRHFVFQLD